MPRLQLRDPARGTLLLTALLAAAGPATAVEFCVRCASPDATYRCQVEGAGADKANVSAAQLRCIGEIARGVGHASCAVDRASAEPCQGKPYVLSPGAAAAAAFTPPEVPVGRDDKVLVPPGPVNRPAPAAAPRPAATVQPNLAPRAVKEPGDAKAADTSAMGAAANSVGNAAKKTWDCVASFFKNC